MLKVGAQVGCDATALEKFRRPARGAPVSYPYSFEDLLALLHGRAPAKVDAVALHRRRVEHGHLSVGLKIHCLGGGSQFSTLVEGLGGAQKILDVNYYKHGTLRGGANPWGRRNRNVEPYWSSRTTLNSVT